MKSISVRTTSSLVVAALVAASPAASTGQELEGTGVVPTGLLLRQLDGVKRVLMIGAHPDDEDTDLLTTLARGWGAETAYLSLTRGDGGQNVIGGELWEGLGIVRTGELVAARSLDGGRQLFTRAFDFGYSKSADEALEFWARDEVLRDVVWVIRTYRPQVIVSVWSGTPNDGHGQHQATGILASEAYEVAADPLRFPEQLDVPGVEAWASDKLYQSRRRFGGGTAEDPGVLTVPTGVRDPLVGRSLLQLARESRSQHRSQDMGASQPLGPGATAVELVAARVANAAGSIFAGVDTTLTSLAGELHASARDEVRAHLASYRNAVARARQRLGVDPDLIVPDLAAAHRALDDALRAAGAPPESEFTRVIATKAQLVTRATMAAAGLSFDVRTEDDLVVPGEQVAVTATVWNGGQREVRVRALGLVVPAGWSATLRGSADGLTSMQSVAAGTLARWTFEVAVPSDADPTELYYLEDDRNGAMYRWPEEAPSLWGLPWDPAPVWGRADFTLPDVDSDAALAVAHTTQVPWRYVGVDPARGEFEKPVLVVPAVGVTVTPAGVVWPQSRTDDASLSVVVRSEAEAGTAGTVRVRAPAGWTVTPEWQPFDLPTPGLERAFSFRVAPDGRTPAGDHRFEIVAEAGGAVFDRGYGLVDYEHIERAALYAPGRATVSVVPIAVDDGLRVGYVMGSGDEGPEAIRQMGVDVVMLDEARVREGGFAGLDAIVLGVRAYETRADLRAASAQLLDFARAGGTIVVQYNRGPLGTLAPAPLQVGRGSPRVSDETAEVTLLDPDAPVFREPNRITRDDFEGWVQERGLYFAAEWDDSYVPLLELADPGEPARHGSLLVREVGDGLFVYTALSFFRQWSARVPGAYRLFANLISLDGVEWRDFANRP